MSKDLERMYQCCDEYKSEDFPSGYRRVLLREDLRMQEAFVSECQQKIFSSGRVTGKRLLDFGCGPTVHRIASASLRFQDITLSEWSETNRREVEKWLSGDEDAMDWTPSFMQCAIAEGYRDLDAGVAEMEERIRKAVKKVVPCDVLSKQILPEGIGEFDAITTNCCLECGCLTPETYKEAVKKLAKYLKKDGALIMTCVLECEEYSAHKVLPVGFLTEELIKEALREAGMELKDWFCWLDSGKYDAFKYKGITVNYSVKL